MCSVVREYAPSSSRPREVDVFETTRVFFAVERRVPLNRDERRRGVKPHLTVEAHVVRSRRGVQRERKLRRGGHSSGRCVR
jgi:hypothetical protein